jgi:hypothetical protein
MLGDTGQAVEPPHARRSTVAFLGHPLDLSQDLFLANHLCLSIAVTTGLGSDINLSRTGDAR